MFERFILYFILIYTCVSYVVNANTSQWYLLVYVEFRLNDYGGTTFLFAFQVVSTVLNLNSVINSYLFIVIDVHIRTINQKTTFFIYNILKRFHNEYLCV